MPIAFDTMVAASLLNEELPIGLKPVAATELGADNWGKGSQNFGLGDMASPKYKITPLYGPEGMGVYCARDTAYSHLLYGIYRKRLMDDQELARLFKHHCLPGMDAVLMMERNGVWIDLERLNPRRDEYRARKEELRLEIMGYVPDVFKPTANFDNDNFLRRWIFGAPPDGLGLEPIKQTAGGQSSVDKDVLQQLQHPAMDLLRSYNDCTKAVEFLDSWEGFADANARIHPNYNITGARTGRRSCDNPNVMQTPRAATIRSIIGAPPGWKWFDADYSMIEVRLSAWAADEQVMLELFRQGKDIYVHTAALINGYTDAAFALLDADVRKKLRQGAKAVVLGFLYGMGPKNFIEYARRTFGVVFTLDEATRFREVFFETYPGLVAWHQRQRSRVKRDGRVHSWLGRIRHLANYYSSDFVTRGKAERAAINSPIQGTGGDCTLAAMNSLYADLLAHPDEILLVMDMHDMIAFQIREDVWVPWVHRILKAMEELPALREHFKGWSPPIRLLAEGSIAQHWGEGTPITLDDFAGPELLSEAWRQKHAA